MEIMELARELGNMLKKTDVMKRAQAAEAAFQADSALQADISEYNAQQQAISSTEDEAFRTSIKERIDSLYDKIIGYPAYVEYLRANEEVSRLMNDVNEEINFAITGEHSSCGGNCSSCGGCH